MPWRKVRAISVVFLRLDNLSWTLIVIIIVIIIMIITIIINFLNFFLTRVSLLHGSKNDN